ncbi:MAG TPA: hypothetical protein VK400_09200, partial [Pyrinomonadaceae bacterium]|nr:hypothetical protein [Pyrinomonadaceae bacterium]
MLNTIPFRTKEFPKIGLWRVHAFGEISLNPKIYNEPLIDVFIVPYNYSEIEPANLNKSDSYNWSRLQSIQIGFGQ